MDAARLDELVWAARRTVLEEIAAVEVEILWLAKDWDPDKHPRDEKGRFGEGGGEGEQSLQTVTKEEFDRLQRAAAEHVASAQRPGPERVAQNREMMARATRSGGEFRGNSRDRARSRDWLVRTFGDGEHVGCVHCGVLLDRSTVTMDKIYTGPEGGRYDHGNILPSCLHCNQSRNDTPIAQTSIGKLVAA